MDLEKKVRDVRNRKWWTIIARWRKYLVE